MSQKKAISYSLFGFNKSRRQNCFDFNSYLRGLYINIRLARLLYPEWDVVVHCDKESAEEFKPLFDNTKGLRVIALEHDKLCKMMLWRMCPLFEMDKGIWKYSHVICRDTDSPLTYKEALCVADWMSKDKCIHAMADSVSHTIPMMGGMVGFQTNGFHARWAAGDFNSMFIGCDIEFENKGSDQDFLNQVIYPKFATHGSDSITQHYFLGMPQTFLSDWHNTIEDKDIGLPEECKALTSPNICGHIGAAGYYNEPLYRELRKFKNHFKDIDEAEMPYKEIFSWHIEKSM